VSTRATLSGALALLRKRNRPRKRRRIRKLRLLALLAVLGLLGLSSFTFGMLTAIAAQVSALDPYQQQTQQQNTYVYASDGHTVLAVLRGSQARVIVTSSQMSPVLKQAIVAIEDKRFYEHHGVDLHGILRAVWADLTSHGAVQGGSTITQQLVKNTINGNAPTLSRKLREAALAWKLEQVESKDEILTQYLNTVYFGNGAYGVEQACQVYFGHSAAQVTPAEAALLAGIPENPSLYDPVAHPIAARDRRGVVLKQMLLQHYLDRDQYRRAVNAKMPNPESVRFPTSQRQKAPYFANYVTDQLVAKYGAKVVFGGGLKVTTTIDLGLQTIAQKAIATVLPPSIGPTAALVAIDVHSGAVVAMIGGRNYHASQFNLATQGERQPGSAFKPFVLAAALKDGISPASTFVSHPVVINAGGRAWSVDNFEHENLGPIDLSKAIAYSDNTVFAQLTNVVGPASVAGVAHDMGITTPLQPYFSIGLGGEPATPLEMARAYATLADGGYRLDSTVFGDQPLTVESVARPGKDVVNNYTSRHELPWLTNGNAAIEDQLLRGVLQYGTGTAAQLPGWDVAGKTGTTENYGDAWFVGFTPDLVTAVWVGYPNKLVPMLHEYHGHTVEGGTYPALIWKAFMKEALPYRKYVRSSLPSASIPYSSPSTVIFRDGRLRLDNGQCRGSATVQFFTGMAPTAVADCKPNEVEVPDVRGVSVETAKSRLTGQPLLSHIEYRAAKPGERVGVVVEQKPHAGTLSSYDTVQLTVSRSLYGVVPKLVGLPVTRARAQLARLKMRARLTGTGGLQGHVVAQSPRSGVAAAPGMRVVLTVQK
jgi:penicillin-binding protein 1A